jgi:tRNA pseudouridine55 synthase
VTAQELKETPADAQPAPREERAPKQQKKRDKRDVHGWVLLDKPVGMTSTHAVA